MAEFRNNFSWSKSREGVFAECARKYYLQYYGFWNGWKEDCDERTRKIYVLKQLTTRQMWAGSKVHERIKRVLNRLRLGQDGPSVDQAIAYTLEEMRADFKNSRSRNYWKNPKSVAFFEHEYEVELSDQVWKEQADKVTQCLKTFFASEIFSRICELAPEQWLELEEFSSFQLNKTKINVVLDFCFRDEDGIHIYDWKTGKSDVESHEVQLACYALYAVEKWKVEPEQVKTTEYNLLSDREISHNAGGIDLTQVKERIIDSVIRMKELLDCAEKNQASEDKFPFAKKERTCERCNFKKICPRWL